MVGQDVRAAASRAENSGPASASPASSNPDSTLPYPIQNPAAPVYPGLAEFMGLELTEDVIRANMPEYLDTHGPSTIAMAPNSSVSDLSKSFDMHNKWH